MATKKQNRIERILEMLQRENGLPVQVFAAQLGVSHMTVRRDLETMREKGMVRQIHGGVLLAGRYAKEPCESPYTLHTAESQNTQAKHLIGVRAAQLVEENDTLIIDSGSTTEYLAANIPNDKNLTILSYSLNIVTETARMSNVHSVFAGGNLHPNTLMFESAEGLAVVRRFRATKAFISAAGVSADFGITCLNGYERETKVAVIQSSARRILLADSTKFGMIRSEYFADLDDIDVIVTDSTLSKEQRRIIEEKGIELILA